MTRRRRKPADPAALAERQKMDERARADLARLRRQPDIAILTDLRGHVAEGTRRTPAFLAVTLSRAQRDATERFEEDYHAWKRQEAAGELLSRVDRSHIFKIPLTQASLEAGERVRAVLKHFSDTYALTLIQLIDPPIEYAPERWRETVRRLHGIRNPAVQAYVVQLTADHLREAYGKIDKLNWIAKKARREKIACAN